MGYINEADLESNIQGQTHHHLRLRDGKDHH
jgi:hypothetical protein